MSLHLQRIDWMPSPPLAPDDGPIDLDHLRRTTFDDDDLEREVLEMFQAQTARILAALGKLPLDSGALAHTLKGSARSIGAVRVADSAEALETAILAGSDPKPALAELREATAEARAAIDLILGLS